MLAEIGFESESMTDLAAKHENYYATQIFDASDELINREIDIFEEELNRELGI
jgi:hypothetical protein